jgi:hypothetical protein
LVSHKLRQDMHGKGYAYSLLNLLKKFPLWPMGVLDPGSEHARPSGWAPIDTSGNFPAHVSAESPSNVLPNPSEVISEGTLGQLLKFSQKNFF